MSKKKRNAGNGTLQPLVRCEDCAHCVAGVSDGECTGCKHADYPPWYSPQRIEREGIVLADKFVPNAPRQPEPLGDMVKPVVGTGVHPCE